MRRTSTSAVLYSYVKLFITRALKTYMSTQRRVLLLSTTPVAIGDSLTTQLTDWLVSSEPCTTKPGNRIDHMYDVIVAMIPSFVCMLKRVEHPFISSLSW